MTDPRHFWKTLFWATVTAGRPHGGIRPRRIALWLARKAYGSQKPEQHEYQWIRDQDGLEFHVHPHFINDLEVIVFGSYDASLQSFIRSQLRPGMVCVDVGANAGLVTLHMGKMVGPLGKVYAFEPVPLLFQKLKQNITRNLLQGTVDPRLCAVSNASGRALMHVHDQHERNQGLAVLVGPVTDVPGEGTDVDCISLDDLAVQEQLDRLDFIKIDVQGAEALVIEGARVCLQRFGPDVVMEVSSGLSPLGKGARDTIELIEDAGYGVFELTAGAIGRRLTSSVLALDFSSSNVLCRKRR